MKITLVVLQLKWRQVMLALKVDLSFKKPRRVASHNIAGPLFVILFNISAVVLTCHLFLGDRDSPWAGTRSVQGFPLLIKYCNRKLRALLWSYQQAVHNMSSQVT